MQPNEITLSVDKLNNGTLTNVVYSRFEEYLNRSVYVGTNHSLDNRDTMSFYRTMPKVSGRFKGTAKSSIKFTRDITVVGTDGLDLVAPQIFEISLSNPIGATTAQTIELRQNGSALIDRDDIMTALQGLLMV